MNVVVVAIVGICAVWVYLDATAHRIGRVPGEKGFFNVSAGAWAAVTLGLWIVGMPAYLVKRSALIEKARTTPVEVKGRAVKTAILVLIAALWLFVTLAGTMAPPSARGPASSSPPEVPTSRQQAVCGDDDCFGSTGTTELRQRLGPRRER